MKAAKARELVMIPRRPMGGAGLSVSALGLGCMGMSEFYGSANENESIATIHRALDRGIDFLDTADVYGLGRNEELIGRALRGRRHQAVLATKFGNIRSSDGKFLYNNGRPEYVQQACEASLRRLGVETIDLYYQHRVDKGVPIEETVGAMAKLVWQGKVRFLGLSEAAPKTLRRAAKVHPIAALQTEYSLWTREPEAEIIPTCRELGIGFVAYSPLGRGFLTGKYRSKDDFAANDARPKTPRFREENLRKNLTLVTRCEKMASAKHCTPSQLALAWLLSQGNDIIPMVGTTRREHLDENMESIGIQFTAEDLARINQELPPGIAVGDRYNAGAMTGLNN